MKTYPEIDYAYRPKSYFDPPDPLSLILSHVKGSNRRRMIRDCWKAGALDKLDDKLLKDTLTEDEIAQLGRIHPSFQGGESMPGFQPNEEEIVRIELDSTLSDTVSVRARPVSRGIAWRIVDEYPDNGKFIIKPKITAKPPTLGELINLLNNVTHEDEGLQGGLILGWNISMLMEETSASELLEFTTVESLFYPQLSLHCQQVFKDWVSENTPAD